MKSTFKKQILLVLAIVISTISCSEDDESIKISASDFSITMDEIPSMSKGEFSTFSIGFIDASVNTNDALSFSLTSETVANALAINTNTGEVIMNDRTAFDFEINPTITATVDITEGSIIKTITVSITLNDVYEDLGDH